LTQLKELTLHSNPLSDTTTIRTSSRAAVPQPPTSSASTSTATTAVLSSSLLSLSSSRRSISSSSGTRRRHRPWLTKTSSNNTRKATTSSRAYRVHVLDLFLNYKAQTGILPLSATFRLWQQAMPRLDGQAVSLVELQALRGRTFQTRQQPSFAMDHNDDQTRHIGRIAAADSSASSASTLSSSKAAKPIASSSSLAPSRRKRHVARINEPGNNSNNISTAAEATVVASTTALSTSSLSPPLQSLWTDSEQGDNSSSVFFQPSHHTKGNSRRQGGRSSSSSSNKTACIPLRAAKNVPPTILMQQQQQQQPESESGEEPDNLAANVSATTAAATTTVTTTKRRAQRLVNFTTLDVLKSLSTFTEPEIVPDEEEPPQPPSESEMQSAEQETKEGVAAASLLINREQESPSESAMAAPVVVNGDGSSTPALQCPEAPLDGLTTGQDDDIASGSVIPAIDVVDSSIDDNGIIDSKTDTDYVANDSGAATMAATNGDVRASPPLNLTNEAVSVCSINSTFAESPSRTSVSNIVSTRSSPKHRRTNSFGESSLGGASSLSRSLQNAMFPDHIWPDDDNNSSILPGSVVSSSQQQPGIKKYQLAEKNAKFVGQHTFKQLLILENLELYFRLFVFCRLSGSDGGGLDASSVSAWDDDIDNWQTVLETYPRIQLYPIDHRIREAAAGQVAERAELDAVGQEDFCRVWREHVVACGKPALRRLTPMRATRLGFHGEVVWTSDAEGGGPVNQDVFIKCRETIICCSSAAIYVIADHDAVTRRTMQDSNATSSPSSNNKNKNKRKLFPLPIPPHACFAEAVWPHAMARHSFQTLRSITIGFGFQRLTLRFSNPTRSQQQQQRHCPDEDFVYILSTCNKLQTISLLKEIQSLANEGRSSTRLLQGGSGGGASSSESFDVDDVQIENDDRHVLEALGMAVAPDDTISMVLHYQILEQVWKHGERGSVRRVCLVTDTKIFLLDEDYHGDGGGGGCGDSRQHTMDKATSPDSGQRRQQERVMGDTLYRLVDKACLEQISIVQAAGADPRAITLVIRPLSRLQRTHNWRLLCRDRDGAERLVEDVRKAISLLE
jgi:hypothetical protein